MIIFEVQVQMQLHLLLIQNTNKLSVIYHLEEMYVLYSNKFQEENIPLLLELMVRKVKLALKKQLLTNYH